MYLTFFGMFLSYKVVLFNLTMLSSIKIVLIKNPILFRQQPGRFTVRREHRLISFVLILHVPNVRRKKAF